MAADQSDGPAEEFALPAGMSPLDLVIAREAQARAACPPSLDPPQHQAPPPRRHTWSSASKALVGLGAVLVAAGILAGVALGLGGGGDETERFFAGAPMPTGRGSVPPTAGVGAGSAEMMQWLLLMYPKEGELALAMVPLYSEEVTRSRVMVLCGELVDEVEDLGTLPPAPDPIVESEFRAYVASAAAFLDTCQSGNGPATAEHNRDMQRHSDAMMERIEQLVG